MKESGWNPWFYLPFFFALVTGTIVFAALPKGQEIILINTWHCPFFDYLFYYGTTLGNGLLFVGVGVALLFKNIRHSIIAFVSFSFTGILVQFLKKIVFSDMVRPSVILADESLHFVEGVVILKKFSFPSGHSAIAFAMFCFLSQTVRPRWLGLVFILMALIGGISRIYLVQHFFVDVYFGALLGVTVTSLVWVVFCRTNKLQHWNGRTLLSYLKPT